MITDEAAIKQLTALAQEVSQREGCQLYDLELVGGGKNRILRVYIDDPVNGVGIDQCADVSRGLSLLLDVEDLVPGGTYELEVSSPGLDRPLRLLWHFEAAVGEKVKVRTNKVIFPLGEEPNKKMKVKQITGELLEATGDEIKVLANGKEWQVPYGVIHRANVVFEFKDTSMKPSKTGGKKKSKSKR